MDECLFCRIVNGEIPATRVYEDDAAIAFEDINPQAPHHVLVVPRRHVGGVAELAPADAELFGRVALAARAVAAARGLSDYRLVVNNGRGAGQTVFHLHVHLLAGRPLGWPPG